MSSCGLLRWFAVLARRKWLKVLFQSIDLCILCWSCCCARCWILQDMDYLESSCVIYIQVRRYDQFEQDKVSILTVTSLRIVKLTLHYDLMASMWFMKDPGDVLRQTSPDVFSIEECPFCVYQIWDIICRSSRCIHVNKQTTSDRLTANGRAIGIPCSHMQCSYMQQNSAWIEGASWLSLIPFWFVANYIIFRTSHFFSWSSSSPFHNSKSWLQKHFNQVRLELNRAERQALEPMHPLVRHSSNADTS